MRSIQFLERRATLRDSINQTVFVANMQCAVCDGETESLNTISTDFEIKNILDFQVLFLNPSNILQAGPKY
jgi:hypothetical protein